MRKMLDLTPGYYAISNHVSLKPRFTYISSRTIHSDYSESYFALYPNPDRDCIHNCYQYLWDNGFANTGGTSSIDRNRIVSCRPMTADEIAEFKPQFNTPL